MTPLDAILSDRSKTHGSFLDNAAVSQALKDVVRYRKSYAELSWDKREAIDMICSKLSRILSGNANETDHWLDIAGYATLVAKSIPVEEASCN
jgi:hypothetical protein